MTDLDRRALLGRLAAGAASLSLIGTAHAGEAASAKGKLKTYPNEHFYGADGKFDAAKAKQAYYEMMEYYKYPIPDRLRGDDFWTLDFNLGKFTEVGMERGQLLRSRDLSSARPDDPRAQARENSRRRPEDGRLARAARLDPHLRRGRGHSGSRGADSAFTPGMRERAAREKTDAR